MLAEIADDQRHAFERDPARQALAEQKVIKILGGLLRQSAVHGEDQTLALLVQ